MPRVVIEVRRQYTREQEIALIDKVFEGLRDAFALPESDRNLRLVVHEPHRFSCPPDRAHPELYTHITIDAFAGRSLEAKRKLYRNLASNLQTLGIPRDHVTVLLRELPRENWGIRGGQAACDVELGFNVEV